MDDGFNNTLVTAYRYEWVGDFNTNLDGKISSYYKITTRYLGPNWNGGVDGIGNEDFWKQNTENDATRTFYALGSIDKYYNEKDFLSQRIAQVGTAAYIISSTSSDSQSGSGDKLYAHVAWLDNKKVGANLRHFANRDMTRYESVYHPVRLFSDK